MKFIQIASLATAFFTVAAAQWNLTTCEGCTEMCWEASGTSIPNPIQFKWRFNAFSLCRSRACFPSRFNSGLCTGDTPEDCERCGIMCETACANEEDPDACYVKRHSEYCELGSASCAAPEDACPKCKDMCTEHCPDLPDGSSCYNECYNNVCVSDFSGSGVCSAEVA